MCSLHEQAWLSTLTYHQRLADIFWCVSNQPVGNTITNVPERTLVKSYRMHGLDLFGAFGNLRIHIL